MGRRGGRGSRGSKGSWGNMNIRDKKGSGDSERSYSSRVTKVIRDCMVIRVVSAV